MRASDQRQLWNDKHARGEHAAYADEPDQFAIEAEGTFERGSYILELGCGVGADARYFASKGHSVEATDFSSVVIGQNKQRFHKGIHFSVLDMAEDFPYDDMQFDVVYAHLSIHYFSDATTREIIREVHRVLKPGGLFIFRCKSNASWEKDISVEVAPNVFVSHKTGHVRHLFSKEYARTILGNLFSVVKLEETSSQYRDNVSSFIDCWAKAR